MADPVLVIDNASGMMKAGFGGEDNPRAVFPTIVGRPRHTGIMVGMGQKNSYVGDEVLSKCGILPIKYPIKNGLITDFDDMERIWHHTFYNELRVAPEEHSVLLTEPSFNKNQSRQKTTQIMFETFFLPSMCLASQPFLVLHSSGRTSGVVLESGESFSCSTPIYEGNILLSCSMKTDFGGKDSTTYLMKILVERRYSFQTTAEREIVKDIKEKLCYVAFDFEKEMKIAETSRDIEKMYELPDGYAIFAGNERFRCAEALFNPSLLDTKDKFGIHQLIHQSILFSDPSLHQTFCNNIILAGGSTMFPGIEQRVKKELSKLSLPEDQLKVICPPERKYSVWIGGSLFSSSASFASHCISKNQYDEFGPQIVDTLCVN